MFSLVSSKHLSEHTIELLLRRAQMFADQKQNELVDKNLSDHTIVNLFFEPSTRTSVSFQMAAHRLGLKTLDFFTENSSVKKGESIIDSLKTLDAIGVDIAVIRHQLDWPSLVANENFNMSLVNAGSGMLEHPTQALLDALTIQQHFGRIRGLTITIVGDILHSRVARSNLCLLKTMGAKVQFAGPCQYKASDIPKAYWVSLEDGIADADVVMMLRIQHERHKSQTNVDRYNERFGLNYMRLKQLSKNAIILHPGPVNRGVEITEDVLEDTRCKVLQQVENGVAVRMAVLEKCIQGGTNEKLVSA